MSKKQQQRGGTQPVKAQPAAARPGSWYHADNLIPLVICAAYLGVHFVPDFDAYDAFGPQWIYILLVDFVVILYILGAKKRFDNALAALARNLFSKLYLAYFLLAGLSVFLAINPTEGLVCYVRLIATLIAFFNLGVVLMNRQDLFGFIAQLLAFILLVESTRTLATLINNTGQMSMTTLILSLKGTTGNKNIFAAGLIVKIPFVLYCIHTGGNLKKTVNIIIFFLGCLTVFLVNARAAFLSLFLISFLYIVFCIIENRKQKNTELLFYRLGRLIIPLVAALFVSQVELSNLQGFEESQAQAYGSVGERLSTISTSDQSSQIRLQLWGHAMDYAAKHPLMGCGYGNWKIASIPYIRVITDDLYVPVHAHNDFAENFAELGIPGGLLYLSLFVTIIVFSLKTFISGTDAEARLISVFTLLAFAGYSIDALFNFPAERPISQVFFVLITALNILAYLKARPAVAQGSKEPSRILKPAVGLVALLLMLPSAFVMYRTYQSLVVQRLIVPDLEREPLQLKWQELFPRIPAIPNLTASGLPFDGIKGRYLSEAGKYDEALVLLNRAIAANPTIAYSDFLKASLFFKVATASPVFNKSKWDSSRANALRAYYTRPRAKTYYQTLMAVLAQVKDTVEIKKAFAEYNHYRPSVFGWDMYLRAMLAATGKGTPALIAMADSGFNKFRNDPTDSLLLQRKAELLNSMNANLPGATPATQAALVAKAQGYYAAGIAAFAKGQATPAPGNKSYYLESARNFIKAGEIITNNYVVYENVGVSYFNMGEFQKSIPWFDKVIAMQAGRDGKSEYFKGVAQYNLGNKPEGCKWIGIASSKGYQEAAAVLQNNCK